MLPEQLLTSALPEMAHETNAAVPRRTSKRKRRRRSGAEIDALVKKFHESGLSRAKFAEEECIPLQTVHSWLRKVRGESTPQRSTASGSANFVQVQLKSDPAATPPSPCLRLELANGRKLSIPEGYAPAELARVLAVLERC